MPPCKRCFMVLVAAGVRRIVTRKEFLAQDSKVGLGVRRKVARGQWRAQLLGHAERSPST